MCCHVMRRTWHRVEKGSAIIENLQTRKTLRRWSGSPKAPRFRPRFALTTSAPRSRLSTPAMDSLNLIFLCWSSLLLGHSSSLSFQLFIAWSKVKSKKSAPLQAIWSISFWWFEVARLDLRVFTPRSCTSCITTDCRKHCF